MEQNVDIPVVDRGGGAGGGLSGFLPGQYSLTAEQIVDNPVPRRRFRGVLQGLHRGPEFNSVFLSRWPIPVEVISRFSASSGSRSVFFDFS